MTNNYFCILKSRCGPCESKHTHTHTIYIGYQSQFFPCIWGCTFFVATESKITKEAAVHCRNGSVIDFPLVMKIIVSLARQAGAHAQKLRFSVYRALFVLCKCNAELEINKNRARPLRIYKTWCVDLFYYSFIHHALCLYCLCLLNNSCDKLCYNK